MLMDYLMCAPNTLVEMSALLGTMQEKSQLKDICEELLKITGLDHYMVVVCRPSSLVSPQTLYIDNLSREWCQHYTDHHLASSDAPMDYCMKMSAPTLWSDLRRQPHYQQARYRKVREQAFAFGLRSGLSVPLHGQSGEFGIFSLISHQDTPAIQGRLRALLPYAQYLGGHIVDAVARNAWLRPEEPATRASDHDGASTKPRLTDRESECLLWASEGKTAWEISRILSIAESTVLFHLNNATVKLGAVNRQHAIAKGLLTQAIRPLLFAGLR